MKKKVLVACEFSGVVRRAFEKQGWDSWSCDLIPSVDDSIHHITGDCLEYLDYGWDLLIGHPPCTDLAVSGAAHFKGKEEKQEVALEFVRALMDAPVKRIAIENPVSIISTRIRKPDQIIQPYQFGHDASKKTCLWLKNLPLLRTTQYVAPRVIEREGKLFNRWSNQTPGGQDKTSPSPDRWKIRSITYEGIAEAMAEQWSGLDDT